MDKTLTDEEVNEVQDKIRDEVAKQLGVELRWILYNGKSRTD